MGDQELELTADEIAAGNGSGEPEAISPLDQLQQQFKEVQESRGHTVDFDVPGYDGNLVASYRLIESKDIEKAVKKLTKVKPISRRNLLIATDVIVMACEEIKLRVNDELQTIASITESETPVRWDSRLAKAMNFGATTAREVVSEVFPTEFAIIDHYRKLSRWMGDTTKEDFEDFLDG